MISLRSTRAAYAWYVGRTSLSSLRCICSRLLVRSSVTITNGSRIVGPLLLVSLQGSCATRHQVNAPPVAAMHASPHEGTSDQEQEDAAPLLRNTRAGCADPGRRGVAADAELLMVFDNVDDLNGAIRQDSPVSGGAPAQDPCPGSRDTAWREYHAPEVNWYYSCVAHKIVAGRRSKEGDSQDKELYVRSIGHFAIAFLAKADFLCPGRPEEHCYPNETPDRMLCESDFTIPCAANGKEGVMEVVDVANLALWRLEDVRHISNWDAYLRQDGHLRLSFDGCVANF